MKKFLITALCAAVSGSLFAETNTTDQRIALLEVELQRLKQDVVEQKQQNQQIITEQAKVIDEVKTVKSTAKYWIDNVDVYGIVRLDGVFDFDDTSARGRTGNQINRVPFHTAAVGSSSDFTIAASRIGINIKNLAGREDVTGKFEGDFWVDHGKGDGRLRIRHAYVAFDDWLLGQTWSLMSNVETITESVDYTQFLGVSTTRVPQVRYDLALNATNKLQVALEYGGDRTSAFPALSGKYSYRDQNLYAMAQGFINEKQAQVENDHIEAISWGVGAGFRYKFNPQQSIQGNYYHIKGDQKFVSYTVQNSSADGAAWGGDFSVNTAKSDLFLSEYDVFTVGYSHQFDEAWRANFASSMIKYDHYHAYAKANPTANKQLIDHAINLFYTPVPHVDLGVEYHLGERENFKGDNADISRVNVSARYTF